MESPFDFSGKRVLITGGTRGIGAALVRGFHDAGAEILLTGSDSARLRDLENIQRAQGMDRITYLAADFNDPLAFAGFLAELAALPTLDVCINNAGINRNNPLPEIVAADLDRIMQVNLRAPMHICRALCPAMLRTPGGGRIVNVSSIWSLIAKEGRAVYGAAKAGLSGFTRHIAVDLAKYNILVNSLSPGFTRTELTESMLTPEEIRELTAQVPLGRIAEPVEMVRVAMFLCSGLNSFITGQNIVVDGGFTIV
jgi:3-oxoacyl-[acyl-carrier protein] reductase